MTACWQAVALLPAGCVLLWAHRRAIRRSAPSAEVHRKFHCTPEFQSARAQLVRAGIGGIHVVTDFDATLTVGTSPQCHDVLGKSPLMPPAAREAFGPLLDFTKPLPPTLSGQCWWERANDILVTCGEPRRGQLMQMVSESGITLRPGALSLLQLLSKHDVPVLVVSAGCTNVIEAFLEARGLLSANVRVCSNRLVWSDTGSVCAAIPSPPVTSSSKDQTHVRNATWFEGHAHRRALLVMGDRCSDLAVAAGVSCDAQLSIGIFNSAGDGDSDGENIASYLAAGFDAVLPGSYASLDPLSELVCEIAAAS